MSTAELYERDFYAWTGATARLLRERRFEELDLENLIEEVESLGRSERRELGNRLEVLMEHLLCLAYLLRADTEGWEWRRTVGEQRRQLEKLLEDNSSLKGCLEEAVAKSWKYARAAFRDRASERKRAPVEEVLPRTCPWTPEELLEENRYFTKEEMVKRTQSSGFRM